STVTALTCASDASRGMVMVFFFQAEDGIRDLIVTGVQTCALPISPWPEPANSHGHGRSRSLNKAPSDTRYSPLDCPRDTPQSQKIGRASVGKECRSRWSPYHEKKRIKRKLRAAVVDVTSSTHDWLV